MSVAFQHGLRPTSKSEYTSYQQFRLEIVNGPSAGTVLVSTGKSTSIGNDQGADLVVGDPMVAAYQCEIVASGDHLNLVDLAQRTSTRVNDVAISVAHLGASAMITIGTTQIQFERMSLSLHVGLSNAKSFGGLVGTSLAMRELFADLERIAPLDDSVHIKGESGSGKRTVGQAIHEQSRRNGGCFWVVDCAAPHREVEKGLVTAFEEGAGGVLYLEQVGEMPQDLQSRLLRVFHNGGPIAVANLRILSSSSVDLRQAVNQGGFDPELYVHLTKHIVHTPSMRRRFADLACLVDRLLETLGVSENALADTLRGAEYLDRLQRYGWPGNVRELLSHLERCVQTNKLLPIGDGLEAANLNAKGPVIPLPDVDICQPIKTGREEWVKYFERMYLTALLDAEKGNVTRAAKAAGIDRGHFYRLMMRCGLR